MFYRVSHCAGKHRNKKDSPCITEPETALVKYGLYSFEVTGVISGWPLTEENIQPCILLIYCMRGRSY
jgi:hypothetical protein